VPDRRHSRTRGDLIETLYAKRGQITMPRMPYRICGRREKPAGLPEPTTSSMLEPFRCILTTFTSVEGNCSASRPDLIDGLLAAPQDEVDGQGCVAPWAISGAGWVSSRWQGASSFSGIEADGAAERELWNIGTATTGLTPT
jgi:hypothetical protein